MDLFSLSTSLIPDGSLVFTLTVVIAGLGIVLATLALLIVIFNFFGKTVHASQERAKRKKEKQAADSKDENEQFPDISKMPVIEPLPPVSAADDGVPPEVVAAISAAVYMLEGEDAVVTSIARKRSRGSAANAWAQAAVIANTRPF